MNNINQKVNPRSPEAIIEQQRRDASKAAVPKSSTAVVPKPAAQSAVALPDNRTDVQRYVDEIAPSTIVGRLVKFSKEGIFAYADDGEPVDEEADFIALCDETLVGWIRFHPEEDAPPDRIQGLLYDGFVMPPRDTLGDLDPSKWPLGLSGKPEDVWKHQICLVLQNTVTREMITFATTSQTGRTGVGILLRHYNRLRRQKKDDLPVVRLKPGGFHHKDPRVGFVPTPSFAIVGHVPRDNAAMPDTSIAADLNDHVPF